SDLVPGDYTINLTSSGGCSVSATYTVRQPDALTVSLTADGMICKGGTTKVYVNATGGNTPYNGTGIFSGVSSGSSSYTVTDAKGCTTTKSISIVNGTSVAPTKPVSINSPEADATGLCGGGNFNYSINSVTTATSYTWTIPVSTTI